MEHGTIKSFDIGSGCGVILHPGNVDVFFSGDRIIGKSRSALKAGDAVYFEIENVQNRLTAINIRKI